MLPTLENICEVLSVPQRQFWKEALFVQYEKNINYILILALIPISSLPEGEKSSVQSLLLVLRTFTVPMYGSLFQATL